jgi:hypothetical protein
VISARLLVAPAPSIWIALGVVVGLGALNKYSMFLFAAVFSAGIVLTSARRQLLTPWPWLAAFLAAAIFSPHVVWELNHGSPSLEFMRRATGLKMTSISPIDFVKEQIVVTNPAIAICWMAGLVGLLFSRRLASWRAHGIAFLVSAAVLIASGKSRASYLAPSYTLLFPAGGVFLEQWTAAHRWIRPVALGVWIVAGLATLPLALPVLPVDRLIGYQQSIGFAPRAEEHARLGPLPQFMADRFGWREMAAAIEQAYLRLPEDERAHTWVFARNYGEAAAIEYFSPMLRGKVLSGHNNYHLWFPSGWDGSEVLVIGDTKTDVEKAFDDVVEVGRGPDNPLSMPYERRLPIYLGRHPHQTLEQLRVAIKHYD